MKNKKPDWTNPEDYEYRGGVFCTEVEFFCWEFLRRNKNYRKDWKRELANFLERKKPLQKRDRFELSFCGVTPDDPKCAKKYGLAWLCDPDEDMPNLSFKNINGSINLSKNDLFALGIDPEALEEIEPIEVPDSKAAYIFDLRLPIKPQIGKANELLLKAQESLKGCGALKLFKPIKTHMDDWATYLRIYDASIECKKPSESAT
jgi:hypothetical protein